LNPGHFPGDICICGCARHAEPKKSLINPPFGFVQRCIIALAAAGGLLALSSPSQAQNNTAYGAGALQSGTKTGFDDSAFGFDSLYHTTTGLANTATGVNALFSNTTGGYNTADGVGALTADTGSDNRAIGFQALRANTTGTANTANGYQALYSNTTGAFNTARRGWGAL
jgi:hypothetical protein